MSQYKDFSSYNEEAENIRPTARIQLIQRILNAANLISSLAAGVPLKWASSYKSFQVLKYQENQDPTDVTSANAVSAVDSILHEAESQLRASQDDMNTLKTELTEMPISGITDWSAGVRLRPDTYYRILSAGGAYNSNYSFCFYSDEDGSFESRIRIMAADTFNNLPNKVDIGPLASIPLVIQTRSDSPDINNTCFRYARLASKEYAEVYDIGAVKFYNASTNKYSLEVDMTVYIYSRGRKTFTSRESKRFIIPDLNNYDFLSGSNIKVVPLEDSNSVSRFEGQYAQTEVPVMGNANADISLGLPDPTNLISILDGMTS